MTAITSANKFCRCLFKVLAIALAVITAFGVVVYAEESTTSATQPTTDSLSELQSQYDALESQMSQNQDRLDKVQDAMNNQEDAVDDLGNEIDDTQNQVYLLLTQQNYLNTEIQNAETQINIISSQLTSLSEQIKNTENYIAEKQAMLDATYELLKMRIRAMYMAGSGSTLEFLLTSEDFSTLLTRAELLVRVAKHDNDLMNSIGSEIEALSQLEAELSADIDAEKKKRDDLDGKKQKLANDKEEAKKNSDKLAEQQALLEEEMKQAQEELDKMDKESDEYKALINRQEDELLILSDQIDQFIKNNGSSTNDKPTEEKPSTGVTSPNATTTSPSDKTTVPNATVTVPNNTAGNSSGNSGGDKNPYLDGSETILASSGMMFPLKNSGVYISSPYGYRSDPFTGEQKFHSGVDLTGGGINGKTVYAVKGGKVIFAGIQRGYGNFVIIDHGNGVSSCYAHMQDNSLKVTAGQTVLQGQPIGKVGSTGYSTGPHLHFEIRINGTTTNPMGAYIKLPG